MGRRAKNLTPHAKKAASRLASQQYASTAHGQETRRIARRAAYRSSTSRKQPSYSFQLDDLPQRLLDLAQRALPTSELFYLAASDTNALDESDLPSWDNPPPYISSPPAETAEEERFTRNLADVMHGRRQRESRVKERARMESGMRMTGDVSRLRESLQEEMQDHLDRWEELDLVVGQHEGCERHSIMAENLLQWSARYVHSLYIEWEALQEGMSSYTDLYHARYAQ